MIHLHNSNIRIQRGNYTFALVVAIIIGLSLFIGGIFYLKSQPTNWLEINATITAIKNETVYVTYEIKGATFTNVLNEYASSMKIGDIVKILVNPVNYNDIVSHSTFSTIILPLFLLGGGSIIILISVVRSILHFKRKKNINTKNIQEINVSSNYSNNNKNLKEDIDIPLAIRSYLKKNKEEKNSDLSNFQNEKTSNKNEIDKPIVKQNDEIKENKINNPYDDERYHIGEIKEDKNNKKLTIFVDETQKIIFQYEKQGFTFKDGSIYSFKNLLDNSLEIYHIKEKIIYDKNYKNSSGYNWPFFYIEKENVWEYLNKKNITFLRFDDINGPSYEVYLKNERIGYIHFYDDIYKELKENNNNINKIKTANHLRIEFKGKYLNEMFLVSFVFSKINILIEYPNK